MMMPPEPAPPPAAAPADWRNLAWALGPPAAALLLRALLVAQADAGEPGWQRLETATLVSDAGQAFWMAARPLVLALLVGGGAIAALVFGLRAALRRHGWARVRPWAIALWLLLWAAVAAGLTASDFNRAHREPLPAQAAKVLLVRELLASKRGPGGAEVYFALADEPEPLRLLAEGQPAEAFPPGSKARLQLQAGRWWGRWGQLTSSFGAAPTPDTGGAARSAPGG